MSKDKNPHPEAEPAEKTATSAENEVAEKEEPKGVSLPKEAVKEVVKIVDETFTAIDKDGSNATPLLLSGIKTLETVVKKYYPNFETNQSHLINMLILTKSVVNGLVGINRSIDDLNRFIIDDDGNKTAIQKYKDPIRSGHILTEDAALAILSATGLEGQYHAPLVNSGFRIQLKRAASEDRIRLDEVLAERMGEIGRHTLGGSYLNSHSYMTRDITKFIMDHMTGHNVKGIGQRDYQKILPLIAEADYPTLLNMITVCEYPDGYEVSVPCGSEPKEGKPPCRHLTTGIIKPAHLMKVDSTMLTSDQRKQICYPMSKRVTVKEIEEYQAAFSVPKPLELMIKGVKWTFEFKRPSLLDRNTVGIKWCDGINAAVEHFMEKREDEHVRERVTTSLLAINTLTNYLPYIKLIRVTDPERELDNSTDNIGAIHKILKRLVDEEGLDKLVDACEEILTNQNPVIHGVPPHKCTRCGFVSKEPIIEVDLETQLFIQALPGTAASVYLGAER